MSPVYSPSPAVQEPPPNTAALYALDDGEPFDIGELFATLLGYKWLILSISALAVLTGGLFAYTATPIYRADGLLQVEQQAALLPGLDALEPLADTAPPVAAEMEILRSRMILGKVVDRLQLDHIARPVYMPLIGQAIARRYAAGGVSEPWFDHPEFAWGGEDIAIERLEVPSWLLGASLRLIAGESGQYRLTDATESWTATGRVGESLRVDLGQNEEIRLFVSRLRARPGTHFEVLRQSRNAAIKDLAGRLAVSERGRSSGMVELRLDGPDRRRLTPQLDEIMLAYVRQNVERRSAEAENTLRFLETQLPALKEQMEAAEEAYDGYRREERSIDINEEAKAIIEQLVEVDTQLVNLRQERETFAQRYRIENPSLTKIDIRIDSLNQRRAELESSISQMPETQQRILRLSRDVEVSTRLYTELLKSAQQLRVAKAGTVGNVRLIDEAAVGAEPIAPRKARILAVSLVLGVLASLALIWLIRSLRAKVDDAETLERQLGRPVYATVPHSKLEVQLSRRLRKGRVEHGVLALAHAEEDAVESLRSLRTTLRFALAEAGRMGIQCTSPAQGDGKSFVSRNLAILLAQAGESVLLMDADMRRGHLHRDFGVRKSDGLSEYLAGERPIDAILKPTGIEGVSLITCGERPPKPTELLMNPRFETLVGELSTRFQHLILDAPPILAVSDAAIIGRSVGVTLMIARAGLHPLAEFEQALKRLKLSGVETSGFVLNDLDTTRMRYRYGYSGYHYQYKYR